MKAIIIILVIILLGAVIALAGGGREAKAWPAQSAALMVPAGGRLSYEQLWAIIAEKDVNTFLVDVRTEQEFKAGAIPTAINIPFDVIAEKLPTEDRSARVIVYCRSGNRSGIAYDTLIRLGFNNVLDFGGVGNWRGELVIAQ